jgi:hypothetical protein
LRQQNAPNHARLGAQGWIAIIELNRRKVSRSYGDRILLFLEKAEGFSRLLGILQANSWHFTVKNVKIGMAKPA